MIKVFIRSVGYALRGIAIASGERNVRIQLIVAILVCWAAAFFGITTTEWIVVTICIGSVLSFEIINTAIEDFVDLVSPEFNPIAGRIKDLAAGAVLLTSITSVVVGVVIFYKYVIAFFQ